MSNRLSGELRSPCHRRFLRMNMTNIRKGLVISDPVEGRRWTE